MAYADKMHFTKSEYIEIKKLWLQTREQQVAELGSEIWMYPFSYLEEYKNKDDGSTDFDNYEYKYDPSESNLDIESFNNDTEEYTVFNVTTKVELWLLKNFKLDCIKREVENQLSEFFYQEIPEALRFNLLDKLDFSIPDSLLFISKQDEIAINFISEYDENEEVTIYEDFVVYGSTDFFRILYEVKEQISGGKQLGYEIAFTYCGLNLLDKNGSTFYEDSEILIPFLRPVFSPLNIKHSYAKIDTEGLDPEQIIISKVNGQCFNLSQWERPDLKRVLFTELPDYLNSLIK